MHHHHVGSVAQGRFKGGGQPHGKNGSRKSEGEILRVQGNRRLISQPDILHHKKHHRSGVGKGRRNGRARHIHVKTENQHRIQNHVQDAAEHHPGAGLLRMSFASQQMAQAQAHHGGNAACRNHPEQIAFGIGKGIRAGSQKGQKGRRASQDARENTSVTAAPPHMLKAET